MSRKQCVFYLLALAGGGALLTSTGSAQQRSASPDASSPISRSSRHASSFSLPVTFEPNVGQAGSGAQFIGRGKGLNVLLTEQGIAVTLPRRAQPNAGAITPG